MSTYATSYIKTTSAAVTRPQDLLSFSFAAKWQSVSGYYRCIQIAALDSTVDLWRIGVNAAGTVGIQTGFIVLDTQTGLYRLRANGLGVSIAVGGVIGDLLEFWFTIAPSGAATFSGAANGGAITSTSGTVTMNQANFDVATIWVGHASGNAGCVALRNAWLGRGVLSVDSLRRFAGV
jgi:hypothetical protein